MDCRPELIRLDDHEKLAYLLSVDKAKAMSGKTLRSIRTKLGWTQQKMAEAIGVRTNTVWRWEKGALGISEPMSRLILSIQANASKATPAEVKR